MSYKTFPVPFLVTFLLNLIVWLKLVRPNLVRVASLQKEEDIMRYNDLTEKAAPSIKDAIMQKPD